MSAVLTHRRTQREQQAEETFNRATKSAVVTAQIRADRERDEFEALTGLKVDRVTGFILRETKNDVDTRGQRPCFSVSSGLPHRSDGDR